MEDNYYPSNIPEPIIVEHLRFLDKLNPYNAKHYHNFYEIYFLIEGDVNFFIDNKTYPISPFNVVFISPQTLHKALIQNKFPYERVVIYFNSDIIIDNNILKKFHQNNKVISLSSKVSKTF